MQSEKRIILETSTRDKQRHVRNEETWKVLGSETPVLGSGGEAKLLAPLTHHVKEIEPALTLEGLVRAIEALSGAETQRVGAKPKSKPRGRS